MKINLAHVLDNILTPEHRTKGLSLYESEDFLYLGHNGHVVRVWSARAVPILEIKKEADRFLAGDAFQDLVKCGGIEICR
jgi:hypothetical protein